MNKYLIAAIILTLYAVSTGYLVYSLSNAREQATVWFNIASDACKNSNRTIYFIPHPKVVSDFCKEVGYKAGHLDSFICGQNEVQCWRPQGINASVMCCVDVLTEKSSKCSYFSNT